MNGYTLIGNFQILKMMTDEEVLNKLEDTTKDATRYQLQTLRSILERNAGVSYLQRYLRGCPAPIDVSTFRQAVPLTCYDDYADYINQLADGVLTDDHDRPLLSVDPLLCFFYSSGTSSMKPKLIPCFDSARGRAASSLAHQSTAVIFRKLFPPRSSVKKILWFYYAGNVTMLKSGYKAMAATAFPVHGNNSNPSRFLSVLVSPKEVILGSDFQQQLYCHLLCGLRHFELVGGIQAPYAISLIKAVSLLESKWEQLCEDLENGFPNAYVNDIPMRDSVIEVLSGPQLNLSRRVRSICEGSCWEGILSKLWRNACYVKCVATGSMEQYYQKLQYYAGKLPLLGGDYFASECCLGINLDIGKPPEQTRYTMLPTAAYFEFAPFDLNTSWVTGEETVDLSGVEKGKMYEVVVTTYRGFYRYRLGDIVKVVGFHNSSPQVEFVMRAPKTSSDIVTERDLVSAMTSFQLVLRTLTTAEIVEFAGFLDLEVSPKKMKIFIEVKGGIFLEKDKVEESLKKCCSSIEDGLGGTYSVMKARGEVGPLLVSVVKHGSFDELSQITIKNGATASQYKPPKILRNQTAVDLMEVSTVLTVSSNSY